MQPVSNFRIILLLLTCAILASSVGCRAMFNAKPIPGVPQPKDRLEAIRELGENANSVPVESHEKYAQTLSSIVHEDTDAVMRRAALLAISKFRTPITEETIRYAEKDHDPEVRQALCEAWKNYGGDTAVMEIIRILNTDSDLDIRHSAIAVLGELKDERAIVALEVPLTDQDPALQYFTIQSLQKITGLTMTDPREWYAWCQERHPDTAVAYQPEEENQEETKSPFLDLLPKDGE